MMKTPCSKTGAGEMVDLRAHLRNWVSLLSLALVFLLMALSGCAGVTADSIAPPISAILSTPIPPFVETDQASAIQARSTTPTA